MVGKKPKEVQRISESERATYHTVLPLSYFNLVADIISNKDDGFSEYSGAANSFFNNEVQNPNLYNKHNSFPLCMVTKLAQEDQDFVHEIITNTVEKLQWNPVEIARQLKVTIYDS